MLVTRAKFAHEVGVSYDTVEAWVRRGYVRCVRVGRRSLVDTTSIRNANAMTLPATPAQHPAKGRAAGVAGKAGGGNGR